MNDKTKVTLEPVDYIEQLPKHVLHKVWIAAMDMMQQYNGRSVNLCIALAVGAEIIEYDYSYAMRFVMPPLAKIKRDFE